MDSIFKPLRNFFVVYIDAILIFFETNEEHTKYFKIICKKFQENEIILLPTKIEVEKL